MNLKISGNVAERGWGDIGEIKRRIRASYRCSYDLRPHLKSKLLSESTELTLIESLIRPVLILNYSVMPEEIEYISVRPSHLNRTTSHEKLLFNVTLYSHDL